MVNGKIFVGDIISNFCSKGKHMKIIYSTIQLITILGFGVILLLGCVRSQYDPKPPKEEKSVEEDSKYVKYEGKGLKINMKEVNKDIKKNECKKVAEMLPANDRLKYLRECGYFD